jgi:hypothetical protein
MMRRIDAKISSIEGSWTFAGWLISDSTSSTPSHAFYTKHGWICPFRICRLGFSSRQPDLSPDQAPHGHHAGLRPAQAVEASRPNIRRESLSRLAERYVRASNDCKNTRAQTARDTQYDREFVVSQQATTASVSRSSDV